MCFNDVAMLINNDDFWFEYGGSQTINPMQAGEGPGFLKSGLGINMRSTKTTRIRAHVHGMFLLSLSGV